MEVTGTVMGQRVRFAGHTLEEWFYRVFFDKSIFDRPFNHKTDQIWATGISVELNEKMNYRKVYKPIKE